MTDNKHLVNLKGKAYLMVAGRIAAFREDFPISGERPGRIVTQRVDGTEGRVCFRAEVYVGDALVATGYAEEPENMNSRHIGGRVVEKVETSAIGRALGLAGYGTDKAFEEDEDDNGSAFIADSPVKRKEPLPRARKRDGDTFRSSGQSVGQEAPAPDSVDPEPVDWKKFHGWLSGIGLTHEDARVAVTGDKDGSLSEWLEEGGTKDEMMKRIEAHAALREAS